MDDKIVIFEETISYKLARVATAFRSALEKQMKKVGLHGGQLSVLFELWNDDGLRQVDIASRLNVKAPTVNKMLKGLVDLGLIVITRTDDDARSSRVYLTGPGYAIREKVSEQWVELEAGYISVITDNEQRFLLDILDKLKIAYTGIKPSLDDD